MRKHTSWQDHLPRSDDTPPPLNGRSSTTSAEKNVCAHRKQNRKNTYIYLEDIWSWSPLLMVILKHPHIML